MCTFFVICFYIFTWIILSIYVYSLWQFLSNGTIIFYLVTLALKFDLLLKNFNLGHNFQTRSNRAFILHMFIPCDKTSHVFLVTRPFMLYHNFWPVTLTLKFDLLLENFNLCHNFKLAGTNVRRAIVVPPASALAWAWALAWACACTKTLTLPITHVLI